VLIHATLEQYGRFLPGLHRESHELDQIADAVDAALRNYASPHRRTIRGLHRPFAVGEKTLVMGVVNVTPDSFSDGGRFLDPDRAIERGLKLAEEGADLVDVGGESTRPGASEVTPEAEWARIGPVLARLHGELKVPISVDTRHAAVAENALDAGADLVNDVGGLRDPEMRHLLARTGAPAVLMHMRGTPSTMQANLDYADVRAEVYGSLSDATEAAIAEGVESDRLLIDPGLGFGKSAAQNLELLAHLGEFRSMGFPIVVGASRKSFLGWALGNVPVEQRLEAGLAAAVVAAGEGADIVRTHDVAPTVRALTLVDSVRRPRPAEGRPGASPTRPRGATSNPSRVG
jgi:dihydropteroate synthase